MNPTISQQIHAIKLRLEETVIPSLKEDAIFAKEQAAFIVMSLDWLLKIHEHQYRYEVVENLEYRDLLFKLSSIDGGAGPVLDEIKISIAMRGPASEDASIPLAELNAQTREFKRLTAQLFNELCGKSESTASAAREMLEDVSLKQGERELALFEGTGFSKSEHGLAVVLGETRLG
jgi:hypothetical protein